MRAMWHEAQFAFWAGCMLVPAVAFGLIARSIGNPLAAGLAGLTGVAGALAGLIGCLPGNSYRVFAFVVLVLNAVAVIVFTPFILSGI